MKENLDRMAEGIKFRPPVSSTKIAERVLEQLVLAHRFLYYVLGTPVISDRAYDTLEAELPDGNRVKESAGSDRECDYTHTVQIIARGLLENANE